MNAIEHASCRRISCLGCVGRSSATCATCRGSEINIRRAARVPRSTPSFPVWTFRMGSVMGGQCCRFPTIWGGAPPFALLSPIVLYFNFSPPIAPIQVSKFNREASRSKHFLLVCHVLICPRVLQIRRLNYYAIKYLDPKKHLEGKKTPFLSFGGSFAS